MPGVWKEEVTSLRERGTGLWGEVALGMQGEVGSWKSYLKISVTGW